MLDARDCIVLATLVGSVALLKFYITIAGGAYLDVIGLMFIVIRDDLLLPIVRTGGVRFYWFLGYL